MAEKPTQLSRAERELACSLGQHPWIPDVEDIRFRVCPFCGTTQYYGKEVKDGRIRKPRRRKPGASS